MGEKPQDDGCTRAACTECQRRKQKCNREWPCNHCQKRKVADKCRFGFRQPSPDDDNNINNTTSAPETSRKRQFDYDTVPVPFTDDNPWDDGESGFEALGYTASHLFANMNTVVEHSRSSKRQKQFFMEQGVCPQLERALYILPPRPYTDALVQNFLNNVNYHYYIIYPPSFLDQYRQWWVMRSSKQPLGLQWTCLLIMVCACSLQYTDEELQRKLEVDLEQTTQKLTEQYHNAARELQSVVPVDHNHTFNVQSLLHSCYWYKSEARFVECWHVLSAAIREAQELGFHQEPVARPMSEFEREMRRRVWCILDTWDWQISALLSRPMIIDRSDCNVGLPSLTLEGYSPSPLLHMKLQSELITRMARRFGLPKNVITPSDVQEYQAIIQAWMDTFPPTYHLRAPDTAADVRRPWIVLHRHYLHTMSLSMLLDPVRAYLAKPMSRDSPADELKIREDGIGHSLDLMRALYRFFNHVYPRDAKFHFVLFCIFDTAALLCSALMHDDDGSIPRHHDVLHAIDEAVAMLRRLNTVTKTAKTSYEILLRVSQRVARAGPVPASCLPPPSARDAEHAPHQQQQQKQQRKRTKTLAPPALTPPIITKQLELGPSTPIDTRLGDENILNSSRSSSSSSGVGDDDIDKHNKNNSSNITIHPAAHGPSDGDIREDSTNNFHDGNTTHRGNIHGGGTTPGAASSTSTSSRADSFAAYTTLPTADPLAALAALPPFAAPDLTAPAEALSATADAQLAYPPHLPQTYPSPEPQSHPSPPPPAPPPPPPQQQQHHSQPPVSAAAVPAASINTTLPMSAPPIDHQPMAMDGYVPAHPYIDLTPPSDDLYLPLEFGNITQQDLGDLASLWNYESLNLNFINPHGA